MCLDILRGGCPFLPTLVRTICSVVVGWCSGISGGDVFVRFGDGKILSSYDWGIANRCRLLQHSFRQFSARMRYDLRCSHLLITFPFLYQVLPSYKQTWSPMLRGESFLVFSRCLLTCLVLVCGSFILGSNVRYSRFISFVAGDRGFSLLSAVRKASNTKSLSSPDFNRVFWPFVLFSLPCHLTVQILGY